MPKDIMSIDFETYSDLDLTKVASSRYSRHRSTEVLMGAVEFNDSGEVLQWDAAGGESMPKIVRDALVDDQCEKWAWNASFEIQITQNALKIPTVIEQWKDTMVMAMSCSLPGALGKAGPIINLDDDHLKDKEGKRLIRKFSMRKKSQRKATKGQMLRTFWYEDVADYEKYLAYNRKDVLSEGAIRRRLRQFDSMSDEEWDLWHVDQRINMAGLPINMRMVRNASRVYHEVLRLQQERMNEITGLENATAPAQLLPWLQDRGYMFDDCQKGHIKTARAYFDEKPDHWEDEQWALYMGDEDLKEVLDLRLETSRTSIKKFDALLNATDADGNLRNVLQFCGAQRTWRWAGRVFQPQNLPRPEKRFEKNIYLHAKQVEELDWQSLALIYGNVFDLLASVIRPAAQAPEGMLLIDADLNAIENRVLGWLANCVKILRVFKEGRDPYIDFATYLFDLPYEVLWHEYKVQGNGAKRTISKPGVLGCLKGDTPVLTDKGWKALVEITVSDWLYDGEKWVRHEGVAFKGYQEVLCGSGVYATLDHRFLTEGGWQEWQSASQPWMFKSALAMGNGVFLQKQGHLEALEKSFFADANVVENEKYQDQTSCEDYPRAAPDALRLTAAPTSENELAQTFTTYSQIVSMLRDRVAKTRKTVPTVITENVEYVAYSVPLTSGYPSSRELSGLMAPSKSTESTMMDITNPEISGSLQGPSRTQIADTWDILNTGDFARFAVLTEDGCLVAHNCGYMLSAGEKRINRKTGEIEATGLLGYAWDMGVKHFTPEQSKLSVDTFRREFHEVKDYWYGIERAAKKCIKTGRAVSYGEGYAKITFDRLGPFMRMILPSGRALHYVRPRVEMQKAPWGDMKETITYEGLNDQKQWVRMSTHPGKLTENADQAISRDLLAHGIMLAYNRGLDIRLHVHDQIIGLSPESEANEQLEILKECMETPPQWAPDIPLGSAGFTSPVFMKD